MSPSERWQAATAISVIQAEKQMVVERSGGPKRSVGGPQAAGAASAVVRYAEPRFPMCVTEREMTGRNFS